MDHELKIGLYRIFSVREKNIFYFSRKWRNRRNERKKVYESMIYNNTLPFHYSFYDVILQKVQGGNRLHYFLFLKSLFSRKTLYRPLN